MEEQDLLYYLSDVDLLGNYNENGKYEIPDIVVKNLIETPKYIDKIEEDNIFCSFSTAYNTYRFWIVVNKNDDDISLSELYYVEDYYEEDEKKELVTPLATCSTFLKENIDEITRRMFRLEEKGDGKDIIETDLIVDTYKKEKKEFYQKTATELSKADKDYVEEMINLLADEDSEIGEEILKALLKKLKSSKFNQKQIGYWIIAKNELHNLITKNKNKLNQKELEKLNMLNNIFITKNNEMLEKFKKEQKQRIKKYQEQLVIAGKQKTINNDLNRDAKTTTQVYSNQDRNSTVLDGDRYHGPHGPGPHGPGPHGPGPHGLGPYGPINENIISLGALVIFGGIMHAAINNQMGQEIQKIYQMTNQNPGNK